MNDTPSASRRPLGSRKSAWAGRLAAWAVQQGYTPNQISRASIAFSALGLICFALSPFGPGFLQFLCLLLAAAAIQGRLVCNLIDGMVAVEGGQGTKDGPFWNEAPDRLSSSSAPGSRPEIPALARLPQRLPLPLLIFANLAGPRALPPISPAPSPNRSAWPS